MPRRPGFTAAYPAGPLSAVLALVLLAFPAWAMGPTHTPAAVR